MDTSSSSSKPVCRRWNDMQSELLEAIMGFLLLLPDYMRFGAVCTSWRQVAHADQENRRRDSHKQPPMLFIPSSDAGSGRLYSIPEQKLYSHALPFSFQTRCCGSSHRWWAYPLTSIQNKTIPVTLQNPFSGAQIALPPISGFFSPHSSYLRRPERYFDKILLSCDLSLYPEDWIAVAIHTDISFTRAGQNLWTIYRVYLTMVKDVCFHQGHLYIFFGESDELVSIDLEVIREGREIRRGTFNRYHTLSVGRSMRKYLVSKDRDLVSGNFPTDGAVTFRVWKLGDNGWEDVKNLGNFSLFLEESGSSSTCVADFPNCRPNCIYYIYHCIDPNWVVGLPNDMGIFDLVTRQISRFYPPQRLKPSAV